MNDKLNIKALSIQEENFNHYKFPCMLIAMPYCNFKCGKEVCQNSQLIDAQEKEYNIIDIIYKYLKNPFSAAIVFAGLEPIESILEIKNFILQFRQVCNDPIIIYTGFEQSEILPIIQWLKMFPNIIVKYGRYIPNQKSHFDGVLGVDLASDNQYAEKIS